MFNRLDIIEHLSNFFRSILILTPGDLIPAIYLSVNRVCSEYLCAVVTRVTRLRQLMKE